MDVRLDLVLLDLKSCKIHSSLPMRVVVVWVYVSRRLLNSSTRTSLCAAQNGNAQFSSLRRVQGLPDLLWVR